MSDFNGDDLDRLSASIIAMNRTMVGLTKTIQEQQKKLSKQTASEPRPTARRAEAPRQSQNPPQQPNTGRPRSSDGVNVSKASNNKTPAGDNGVGSLWGASKKATGAMTDSTVNASNSLRKLDSEFGLVADALGNFKGVVGVFGALAYVGNMLGETLDTYKSLADVGQTFGGSMGQMQLAAAEARMPLEQFASTIKNYSKVIAITGVQSFGAMNKNLRDSLSGLGLLGMSTGELSDFMGDYLEMQRKSGNLGRLSDASTMNNMRTMAIEASKVSALTGESRKKILENTMAAMTENSFMTKKFMMTAEAVGRLEKGMTTASTYLAGMPGEAGTRLSNMLAETVGKGTAVLSEDVQTFSRLGMGGVVSMFDNLAEKTKNGTATIEDMEAFRADFVAQGKANMASLQYQANHANNPEAKRALEMIMEMSNMSKEKMKELAEQQKVTNFLMNLQNSLQTITAFFKEKFIKSIMAVTGNIEDFSKTPAFKDLQERIGETAEKLGSWIGGILADEKKMKEIVDTIMNVITGTGNLIMWVAETAGKLAPVFEALTSAVGSVISIVATVVDKFGLFGVLMVAAAVKTAISLKNAVSSYVGDALGKLRGDSGSLMKGGKFGRNGALLVYMDGMPGSGDRPRDGKDGKPGSGKDGKDGKPGSGKDGKSGRDGKDGNANNRNDQVNDPKNGKGRGKGNRAQRRAAERARRAGRASAGGGVASMIGSNLATPMDIDDGDGPSVDPMDKKSNDPAKGKKPEAPKKNKWLDKLSKIKTPSFGTIAKGGGIAGLALQVGADQYAESGGPGAASVGVMADTASWAATGAMVGGPLGALAGGVLGGGYSLYKNWDAVSGEVGSLFGSKTDNKVSAFEGEKAVAVSDTNGSKISDAQKKTVADSRVEPISTITTNDMGALDSTPIDMNSEMLSINRQVLLNLEKLNGNVETGTAVQRVGLGEMVSNTQNKGYKTGTEFS